jgi:hypothetical protein
VAAIGPRTEGMAARVRGHVRAAAATAQPRAACHAETRGAARPSSSGGFCCQQTAAVRPQHLQKSKRP